MSDQAAQQYDSLATEIARLAADARQKDRPLFLIVQYEHEAVKIAFLGELRQALRQHGLISQSFDPGQRPEHGSGQLYPCLVKAAAASALALITGLPRLSENNHLDASFLEYLNLHRDLIARQKLRLVLFLHTAECGDFIVKAGDLWDFRHHTFWLEGKPEVNMLSWWENTRETKNVVLSAAEQEEVTRHIQQVQSLVSQTTDGEEKAALLLGLSNWLFRRHLYGLSARIASEGISLLSDASTSLAGDLEFRLGMALNKECQLDMALDHLGRALAIRRVIGDRAGEGTSLNNISQIYHSWGQNKKALQTLEESLAIRREIGDRPGEGATLNNISEIYRFWGQNEKALQILDESLAISREIDDRAGEGTMLNNISQVYRSWGQTEKALQTLEESLAISREIDDRAGEGTTLNNIAEIYYSWGQNEKALQTLEESLAISREIGDQDIEGTTLNNISQIYHSWGQNEKALQTLEESLAISREIGDRAGEGATLNNISQIYNSWGCYDKVLQLLEESLAIRREIGDRAGEGVCCQNLAVEYLRRGDLAQAVDYARITVAIKKEIQHPDYEKDQQNLEKLIQQLHRQQTQTSQANDPAE